MYLSFFLFVLSVLTYMAFNALHALIFCVDSDDIHSIECITPFDPLYQQCQHCQYILAHNFLNIQQIFNLKKFWKAQNQGFLPVSTVLTLPVHFGIECIGNLTTHIDSINIYRI